MKSAHAQAAAMIRKQLKANGIKARVRSESYSMGSSIRVKVLQDLVPAALEEVKAYCNQFQYGHFDGMVDMYENSNSRDDIPQVKYVFVEIEYSEELKQAVKDYISEIGGIEEHERWRYENLVYSGNRNWSGDFWANYKPRLRAA